MAMVPDVERRGEVGAQSACSSDGVFAAASLATHTNLDAIRCLNVGSRADYSFLPSLDLRAPSGNNVRNTPSTAQREQLVDKAVNELHLPESWRAQPGQTDNQRLLAYGLTSMTVQLLGDIDAMDKLHSMQTLGPSFPFDPPKGVSIDRDDSGKITKIDLHMPTDLSKINADDVDHLRVLNSWLKQSEPRIAHVTEQLGRISTGRDSPIEEGDQPISNDRSGGGSAKQESINLLQSRFTAGDDLLAPGDINVEQTAQGQHVPWYGYQNSFADNVGAPIVASHSFKPDDYAVVVSDGTMKLVQAKFLPLFGEMEDTKRKSNTESAVTMDIGLALTGGAEVGLAVRSGEALFAGGARFLGVLGGRAGAIAAGTAKAVIGGAGLLNNAGVNETQTGREFNRIRGYLFLLEAGASLAEGGAAKFGFKRPTSEAAFEAASARNPAAALGRSAGALSFGLGIPVAGGLVSSQLMEQVAEFGSPDYGQNALDAYLAGQKLPRTGQR